MTQSLWYTFKQLNGNSFFMICHFLMKIIAHSSWHVISELLISQTSYLIEFFFILRGQLVYNMFIKLDNEPCRIIRTSCHDQGVLTYLFNLVVSISNITFGMFVSHLNLNTIRDKLLPQLFIHCIKLIPLYTYYVNGICGCNGVHF